MKYVCLLRGVNVGGKGKVAMGELRSELEQVGLAKVHTYIQSGNIIFESNETDTLKLSRRVEFCIDEKFDVAVKAVVFSSDDYQTIVKAAPKNWGDDPAWKYNTLFLIPPVTTNDVIKGIGELKPDIETITPVNGALYQSMSIELFGRTTTSKLASTAVYQQLTIRNWNTTKKLLELLTAS